MICPSCGMKNNYYHRYCFNCGTKLIDDEAENISMEKEWGYADYEDIAPTWDDEPDKPEDQLEVFDAELIDPWDEEEEDNEPEDETPPDDELTDEAEDTPADPSKNDDANALDWHEQYELWKNSLEPQTDYYSDYLFSDNEDSEFDIQTQLPLRRYKKPERKTGALKKVLKAIVSILLISLIVFLGYVGYVELIQKTAANKPPVMEIDVDYWVEEIQLDGKTGRKISVKSSLGEQVKLMDKVAAITGGKAEIILMDNEFDINDFEQSDGYLQVILPLTVMADGYPSRTEEVRFEIPVRYAPLEFVSPADKEAVVEGSTYQLMLKVLPGSKIIIDGNNYSHVVDEEGLLTLQLELPDQPEIRYEIHVSADGYEDTYEEVVFKRKQMEFALSIDQEIPIQASENTWVEITGITHPEAKLSANLEVRDDVTVDSETGNFAMHVKAPSKGYTPLILTAELEGKEDSVLEAVIHRPVSEYEYTHSAWAFDYNNLKTYPDLHNGVAFVFSGTVNKVESTGLKTILLVDTASQGQSEQLVHVEYWGTISASPGQKVRIFGNRWGNKGDYPFVIASYVYK